MIASNKKRIKVFILFQFKVSSTLKFKVNNLSLSGSTVIPKTDASTLAKGFCKNH
jgi:hypothetical protein